MSDVGIEQLEIEFPPMENTARTGLGHLETDSLSPGTRELYSCLSSIVVLYHGAIRGLADERRSNTDQRPQLQSTFEGVFKGA
jgi:hypothetical protein